MAVTPQNSDVFVREVDEELRRDQMATAWKRYGRWLIAGIVAALLAFGGWLLWQNWQARQAAALGEKFDVAMDKVGANDGKGASPALAELVGSNNDGYRAMALFTQADILLQAKDDAGAAAKFAAVAGDASLPAPLRELALVRQTSAEFDKLAPQAVIDRLKPLAVAGNPWFGSAGEMTAAAYLKMNRRDLAGRLLGQVARDAGVPASIRQRAVQMAGVLGVDAVDTAQQGNTAR